MAEGTAWLIAVPSILVAWLALACWIETTDKFDD